MAEPTDKKLEIVPTEQGLEGPATPEPVEAAVPAPRLARRFRRLLAFDGDDVKDIVYQHSVLTQTCIPYRDPGDDCRVWERRNGDVRLEIQAGRVHSPETDQFVDVGLPYGPKPRLILYHLNTQAIVTRSPVIELEDSLTAFVRRTLSLDVHGRNLKMVKEQLLRLSAADFRLGSRVSNERSVTVKSTIIEGLEVWSPRDARQKVLWPTTVQFSQRYFESLMEHAVPLNERAVALLQNNAMALDIYTWLAQRLHRIDPTKVQLVTWVNLKEQFGQGYDQIRDFRRVFKRTLDKVRAVYPCNISVTPRGLFLKQSPPPIPRRLSVLVSR